jgi:protein-disulfide isomerase
MSKTFWAVIAIIVIIFGGLVVMNKKDEAVRTAGVKPTNHVIGNTSTGVRLIEYGDYECPACGRYYPLVEQVKEKYKDKIQFQFRNLPLLQVHQHAFAAARAAEAADKQGKFWEMYNLLFQNQTTWSAGSNPSQFFEQYAKQLGMNLTVFKKDIASTAVNDVINADMNEFKKTKQEVSTPTFFLEGKKIKPTSLEEFSKLIDDAIAKKSQS